MKLRKRIFPQMNDKLFELVFNEYLTIAEEGIEEFFTPCAEVEKAMEYTLSAGGKRVRPVLALAVCDMLGGDVTKALPYAVAIELIHTYSLIHDDLPCMDDDAERRGKPACHIVFGEGMALLAGDGLLTKAFEIAAKGESLEAIAVIAANAYKMVLGQGSEFVNKDVSVSVDNTLEIYSHKTSALLVGAAVCGALAAGAKKEDIEKIEEFALNLGLAFQVIDDLLDADEEDSLFISAVGRKKAEEYAAEFSEKAYAAVSDFKKNEFVTELINKLLHRKG